MTSFMPSFQFESTTKEPWAPAQPALNTALGGAMQAYNSTYQGPQVAALDPNVTAGQEDILANANLGLSRGAANDALTRLRTILASGGLGEYQTQGAGATQQGLSTLGGVTSNLSPYATGAYLKSGGNTYLDQIIQNALSDAARGVNAQFSLAGRYGSGAHAGSLADRLGRIAMDTRFQDYNQQQQNQLAANRDLLNAASGYGGLGGTLAGIGQQGVSNLFGAGPALSGLSAAQSADAAAKMGVGGQRMDYEQQLINAKNEAPWARVGNLAQIAGGIGGMGGTSSGTSVGFQNQPSQPSNFSPGQWVGGGITGASMLANFANGLKNVGGWTGLASTLLPSVFGPSDERFKENIEEVGKLDNGLKVYAYNYKSGGPRHIGLLAQEVEKVNPKAVARDSDGMRYVDYGRATSPGRASTHDR